MKIFYDGMHVTDEGSHVYATHIASRLLSSATEIAANRRREQTVASREGKELPAVSAPPVSSPREAN